MRLEESHLFLASGTRADRRTRREPSHVNGLAPSGGASFISPSCGRVPPAVMPGRNTCELMRDCAKCVIPITAGSAALTWARRDRQQVAEWESGARSECQTFAPRLQAGLLLHHRSANAHTASISE